MLKNLKACKKLLPCLALAAIFIFGSAMRFPADAISPKPATIQASTGDYFNSAYEKTLEFVQPLWGKIKVFADQPKDWNQITQNLIQYAKEKPLVAAGVGAGVIWIPFGLFRAFRSKKEEDNPDYDEFMNSEFEEEDDDEEEEDDDEEYQKNLREFEEENDEESEEAELIEDETAEEEVEVTAETTEENELEKAEEEYETALLEDDETEEDVFEDFESESFGDTEDDFGFLEEEDEDSIFGEEDEEEDEFAALRDEEESDEDSELSDIFSESPSDSEDTAPVATKDFSAGSDDSDDVLKKLEDEFAALESEFNEVDDFIEHENQKNDSLDLNKEIDSGSEKVISEEESSSEVDQLLSASEALSNIDTPSPNKDLDSDPYENSSLPPSVMDLINKEAVMSNPEPASANPAPPSSQEKGTKGIEIDSLEDEEEMDQTLKDLQAEMEQTIQEISAQIDSESEFQSEVASEELTTFDTPSIEEENPVETASILEDEVDSESTLETILKEAEEEAEKELKDLLPENSVFLEEESISEKESIEEPPNLEEEIPETQTIPDTVEETFKDIFAEAIENDTFQDIESEEKSNDPDFAAAELTTEAENVDEIISMVEDEEDSQETELPHSILAEEKLTEFPDLTLESPDAFDPLLPALDAATHMEAPEAKDEQQSIDPVKANNYIKSLGAFQRNLEKRLNTLRYFPPSEEIQQPTPQVQEFEVEEPVTIEPDIDFEHIGESAEKKYSLELMESFILLDHQK